MARGGPGIQPCRCCCGGSAPYSAPSSASSRIPLIPRSPGFGLCPPLKSQPVFAAGSVLPERGKLRGILSLFIISGLLSGWWHFHQQVSSRLCGLSVELLRFTAPKIYMHNSFRDDIFLLEMSGRCGTASLQWETRFHLQDRVSSTCRTSICLAA